MFAHFLVASLVELVVCVSMIKVAMEARFEGEAIHDVELPPQDDSGGFQLRCLQSEATGVISELLRLFS